MKYSKNYIGEYDFEELKEAALKYNATQEEINSLGKWFEMYGYAQYWNGEFFDIDGLYRLFPAYEKINEDDYEIVGYELN